LARGTGRSALAETPKARGPESDSLSQAAQRIRVVAWNLYGTLLRIADGDLLFEVPQELRMQIALEKVDAEFNMWNHMYRKPVAPWKYLYEQYQKLLERQKMTATKQKGDLPAIKSDQIWRQILAQLEEKDYEYDADFYGTMDELAEKVAYFFHASLQGLEAAPGALDALKMVSGRRLLQGLIADAQSFTLPQFLKCLKPRVRCRLWVICSSRV
jgi:hypothetical protein